MNGSDFLRIHKLEVENEQLKKELEKAEKDRLFLEKLVHYLNLTTDRLE